MENTVYSLSGEKFGELPCIVTTFETAEKLIVARIVRSVLQNVFRMGGAGVYTMGVHHLEYSMPSIYPINYHWDVKPADDQNSVTITINRDNDLVMSFVIPLSVDTYGRVPDSTNKESI